MSQIISRGLGTLLVITPTRELALQVSDELFKLGRIAGIKTVPVYGGQPMKRQIDLINRGSEVVVATPGRLLDLLSSGSIKNFKPGMVVLDEADEMLSMGFIEDVQKIFNYIPAQRQTLLFSATVPSAIQRLSRQILKDPVTIDISGEGEATPNDIEQICHMVQDRERTDALVRLIDAEKPEKAMIFCRTKRDADLLCTELSDKGYKVRALHGDIAQNQRQEVLKSFRQGSTNILVATDVAARGIDVAEVSHVFNYHLPRDPESYVHRIGRTGRAGRTGKAITLIEPAEHGKLKRIESTLRVRLKALPIPTRSEVEKRFNHRLLDDLQSQAPSQEIFDLIASLQKEMDLHVLAAKLLAMKQSEIHIHGPDAIGFSQNQIEEFVTRRSTRWQKPTEPTSRRRFTDRPQRSSRSYGENRSGGKSSYSFPSAGKPRPKKRRPT